MIALNKYIFILLFYFRYMVSRKKYTGLTVKYCLLHTGVHNRTYESKSGNNYTILGLPVDRAEGEGAVVLVRYVGSGREGYLNLDKIIRDREVKSRR